MAFVNEGFWHYFANMNMRLFVFEINSILTFSSADFAVNQAEQDIDLVVQGKLSPCQIAFSVALLNIKIWQQKNQKLKWKTTFYRKTHWTRYWPCAEGQLSPCRIAFLFALLNIKIWPQQKLKYKWNTDWTGYWPCAEGKLSPPVKLLFIGLNITLQKNYPNFLLS